MLWEVEGEGRELGVMLWGGMDGGGGGGGDDLGGVRRKRARVEGGWVVG